MTIGQAPDRRAGVGTRSRRSRSGKDAPASDVVRGLGLVLTGVLFGATVALVKGDGAGARDVVGNLGAPWLMLAVLCGLSVRGLATAVWSATLACGALLAFYGTVALGEDAPSWSRFFFIVRFNARYFLVGVAVCVVITFFAKVFVRRSTRHFLGASALLLIAEPVFIFWVREVHKSVRLGAGGGVSWVYLVEFVTGILVLWASLRRSGPPRVARDFQG